MNDLVFEIVHEVEVRDVEVPHCAQRQINRPLPVGPVAQLPPDLAQRAQDAGPVETLPFAMLAVVHDLLSMSHS